MHDARCGSAGLRFLDEEHARLGGDHKSGGGEWAGRSVSRNCFRFFFRYCGNSVPCCNLPLTAPIRGGRSTIVSTGTLPPHDPLRSAPSKLEYSTLPKLAEHEYHFGRFPALMYTCGSPSASP